MKIESNTIYISFVLLFTVLLLCSVLTITPPDSVLKNVNGSSEEDEQEEEEPEETDQFGGGFSRGPSGADDTSGAGGGRQPSFDDVVDLCPPGHYYATSPSGERSCQPGPSGADDTSGTLPLLNERTTTEPLKKGSLGFLEGSTIDPKTGEATTPEQVEPITIPEGETTSLPEGEPEEEQEPEE